MVFGMKVFFSPVVWTGFPFFLAAPARFAYLLGTSPLGYPFGFLVRFCWACYAQVGYSMHRTPPHSDRGGLEHLESGWSDGLNSYAVLEGLNGNVVMLE